MEYPSPDLREVAVYGVGVVGHREIASRVRDPDIERSAFDRDRAGRATKGMRVADQQRARDEPHAAGERIRRTDREQAAVERDAAGRRVERPADRERPGPLLHERHAGPRDRAPDRERARIDRDLPGCARAAEGDRRGARIERVRAGEREVTVPGDGVEQGSSCAIRVERAAVERERGAGQAERACVGDQDGARVERKPAGERIVRGVQA